MDDNTLKYLWLNSCKEQNVEVNTDKLIDSINKKISDMERLVKRRDRLEIFLAVFMTALFGWWLLADVHTLAKIGDAIIIAGCLLVIFKLLYARKVNVKQDNASEIKYYLMVSLEHTRKQIKLLSTVLWWYLLPFFIGIACIFCAYLPSLLSKAIYIAIVAVLYGYIYYLNKRAVKNNLRPLENNLIKALEELSASS